MLRKEIKVMKVYNPFADSYEELACSFELHINSRNKLDHVDITSIVTDSGVELYKYISQKFLEEIADNFFNEYEG